MTQVLSQDDPFADRYILERYDMRNGNFNLRDAIQIPSTFSGDSWAPVKEDCLNPNGADTNASLAIVWQSTSSPSKLAVTNHFYYAGFMWKRYFFTSPTGADLIFHQFKAESPGEEKNGL